jgi:YidC/Oxa1 family membrane protein insertase
MDKQATIGFVIIGGILILWLFLNSPKPPNQKPAGTDTTTTLVDTAAKKNLANNEKVQKENKEQKQSKKITNPNQKEITQSVLDYGKYFTPSAGQGKIITVKNSLVTLELSTKGGSIKKYYLNKYKNWYSAHSSDTANFYKTHVQLINYEKGNEYNLSFVTTDGKAINTKNLNFNVDANKSEYTVRHGDSLTISFTYNVAPDKYLRKTYVFYGDKYSFKSDIELKGMNDIISNDTYDVVWSNGIRFVEENSVDEARFSNASVYYGGEQVVVDASSKGEKKEKNFNGVVDWAAVRNKYFAAIIAPANPSKVDGAYIEGQNQAVGNEGENETYNVHLSMTYNNTSDEQRQFTVYIGPVDYNTLKPYGDNLTAIVDFGSFLGLTFLIRPISEYILLPLFNLLHTVIPNYGFVIIVFSLIIKFVLYPFTKTSYQSMKKMQLLQPKITELKEKYKDDPQRQQKETMKLYSTYGVNPAGGCLPLLLQMPIFIALYDFLRVAVELRQQPFIFWIKDLSQADVIYNLPFKLPIFGVDQISGLALLMGITTFIQQKMSVKDPKQQGLVYIMPIALTLMFMSFPSGLNLYYFMFNIFSIGQQYYINHKQGDAELKPVKNPNKKKGFMQRMMEAAEQNAKTQQQQKKRR